MSNTKQSQKGWDNSTNTQIQTVVVNNNWLDYQWVKEIVLDVFSNNFLVLKNQAIEEAVKRANEFTEKFIIELQDRKIDSMEWVKDPWFQYTLFEAQKNYAKSWDRDMEDVLIDVLVDRLNYTERNLKQIVLDESVQIIPKLTNSQLDALTIIFLLKYSKHTNLSDHNWLKRYLETYIKPFVNNLSKEHSAYQHLEFTWCWSISMWHRNIEDIFKTNYKWLFFEWFDEEYFKKDIWDLKDYWDLMIKCLNNPDKFQCNALNEETRKERIETKSLDEAIKQKLNNLFNQHITSNKSIKEKLIELWGQEITNLFEIWESSSIKNMTLTSVWIAIAQANFRRKTWITLDLNIWIK